MDERISHIIENYNDKEATYGNGLTNHLNMGLFALYKMGAKDERIHDFARFYIEDRGISVHDFSLDDKEGKDKVNIDTSNWTQYLGGHHIYYGPLALFYKEELENKGTEQVLRHYLNKLIQGSAGDAFHGLIRMAYAVELEGLDELAKALAYFTDSYCEFDIYDEAMPIIEPLEAIGSLSELDYYKTIVFKRPLIIGRIQDVYEDEMTREVVSAIDEHYCNSDYFAKLLIKLFGMTGNFTILHGLTSTHAIRVLSPYLENTETLYKRHWFLLQLAYLSTGCCDIKRLPKIQKELNWFELFEKAMASQDIHTHKLTYSMFEESKALGDDRLNDLYKTILALRMNGD